MALLLAILIVVPPWIYFSNKVAKKATKRGKNYFIWFIICLLFDPIIGFLLLSIASDDS
jgi:hypothetical protein